MKNLLEAANPVASINLCLGAQEFRHARPANGCRSADQGGEHAGFVGTALLVCDHGEPVGHIDQGD
jgi:hypothetical protein